MYALQQPLIPCRVAIVDSDPILNDALSALLRAKGHTVIQAFRAEEIPLITEQSPDFIVIDPVYETCDQFLLCDYLKNPEHAGVIILSFDQSIERRNALFECGILDYFSKNEPLEYIAEDLMRLFETIQTNKGNSITVISNNETVYSRISGMLIHRKYDCNLQKDILSAHTK